LRYVLAERLNDFAIAYQAALDFAQEEKASVLIEVRTDRANNLDEHKRLQALIASRLEAAAQ
jgi:2-succinyl-5-enolpyruvyl-6-hydroxy-3-cyclohexene-1-carboxylate synthase